MTYTHLIPGNIIRYNNQVWLAVQRTKKTLHLVAFSNSKATLRLDSDPPAGTPVYLDKDAASYIIGLISDTF